MALKTYAFPICRHNQAPGGAAFRAVISLHRWQLGIEVQFCQGWGFMPWRQRFESLRVMLIWWHLVCRPRA